VSPEVQLATAFAEAHPDELSRLAERLGPAAYAELLAALPREQAASLLTHAMPLTAALALSLVAPGAAAALLSELDARTAGTIVLRLTQEARERVYEELPIKLAKALRALTSYGEDRAGGRMDPAVLALPSTTAISEALRELRANPAGALNYCYAVDADGRLVGVAGLRELLGAPRSAALTSVMTPTPVALYADDPLPVVVAHAGWRRHHALPVIDREGRLLGAIRYSAFRALEAELGQKHRASPEGATASAFAELCGIGLGAASRIATITLDAPRSPEGAKS
jgi:magnesium transporter